MTVAVTLLVLLAAGLHASWNVLLKSSADPLSTATRAVGTSALIITPFALGAWLATGRPGLSAQTWAVLLASALAELAYFNFLSRAYRLGDLSLVYPLARGTGPVIAVLGGLVVLGERLSPLELVGVAALVAGIWAVRRPAGGAAVLPALATGLMIGTYTTLDKVGVGLAPPWLFAYVLWAALALLLAAWTRLRPFSAADGEPALTSIGIGLLMTGAYAITLFALSVLPVAIVAPLRESAIVLVTGWGIWRLHERRGALVKVGGAVAIVAGIALLAFA